MREIARQYQVSLLSLTIKTRAHHELQQVYLKVEAKGGGVKDLHILILGIANRVTPQLMTASEQLDWTRMFTPLTGSKKLSLAGIPFGSPHVVAAIEAAAQCCLKLESLVLPSEVHDVEESKVKGMLDALYKALQQWRTKGNSRGLKRLKVPTRYSEKRFHDNQVFFVNVATNCPVIECLDGYKTSLVTHHRLECKDMWLLLVEDWEDVNALCTNLREFHWAVTTFGDPYFRTFGKHVKPRLKKLSFGVSMGWNWRWYFHDTSKAAGELPDNNWEEQEYCKRPGYGYLATCASEALKGCPALEELVVQLYHPTDSDEVGVIDFPDHEMVNQNMFGDQFCETLAAHCPFLTRLIMRKLQSSTTLKS